MRRSCLYAAALIGLVFAACGGENDAEKDASGTISEAKAIETVKDQFPEFRGYPSDKLPPKSIKTERADDGWYAAFIQEGSGRPIISATCFFVDDTGNIVSTKTYSPAVDDADSADGISPVTCSA